MPRFQAVSWLEAGSGKVALPRSAPLDRACRDHQPFTPTGRFAGVLTQYPVGA
ncbi:MAG TPA: hypothetical protein VK206_01590 [Anaerolineales bacterium]|nr:hypothetical protein [Anaerolineales bacterium]